MTYLACTGSATTKKRTRAEKKPKIIPKTRVGESVDPYISKQAPNETKYYEKAMQ